MSVDPSYNYKDILLKVASGDEQAFSFLFKKEYPAVYNAALLVTADAELAEEVVQDVFLKIWLKRKDLSNVISFRNYVFIIARNQAYKTLKNQLRWKTSAELTADHDAIHLTDLRETLLPEQVWNIMEQAITQLPEQQQRVFRMSRLQRMKRNEVAAAMNISPETVKKYLASAALKIRAYCQHHHPELFLEINYFIIPPFLLFQAL